MATATEPRTYTPEDLLAITDRPMPELIDGHLVEREMSLKSDAIAATALFFIKLHVRERDLGSVNGAQGSYQIFPDDPRKVRIPDVSFTRKERLPEGPGDGHGRVAPDLVVEVVSPNDAAEDLLIKVRDFLAAGVRLAWVFYPDTRAVQVFRDLDSSGFLSGDDALEGGDVLPGFRVPVGEFFK